MELSIFELSTEELDKLVFDRLIVGFMKHTGDPYPLATQKFIGMPAKLKKKLIKKAKRKFLLEERKKQIWRSHK